MNKRNLALVFLGVLLISAYLLLLSVSNSKQEEILPPENATTTPVVMPIVEPVETSLPYGKVTLVVGETAKFENLSVTLLRITDDSRCATGLTCIWAGTVHVEIQTVTGMGISTKKLELGKFLTTEAEKITLLSIAPYPMKERAIRQDEYRVIFEVAVRNNVVTDVPKQGPCYVGGCSSQLCSDTQDTASTCEYREEYACYKSATCKRQADGLCGWTQTEELKRCLSAGGLPQM